MNNKKIVIFGDTMFSEELKNIISLECGNDKVIAYVGSPAKIISDKTSVEIITKV